MSSEQDLDCTKAVSTIEINACAQVVLDDLEMEMQRYLDKAIEHASATGEDKDLISEIKKSQSDWELYRKSQCSAVYTRYIGGTIRGGMSLSCKQDLTKDRTYQIWNHFLTELSGSSVLAEPKR